MTFLALLAIMYLGDLETHPPDPLPLVREGGVELERGFTPLLNLFPLSKDGEGDKGGEVTK
jgi:hypothetical protein